MEHYTIEQQGMLKMLERLYQLLKNRKTITWGDIAYEIGLDAKYWRKLINGGIIENTNFPSKPRYQWVSRIPPNIHMAVETLKTDLPDYSNENIQKEFNVISVNNGNQKAIKSINIPFIDFWNLYDKKVGDKTKIEIQWNKLSDKNRMLIMEYIPKYIQAFPDKYYRKHPSTFFNNKSWLDEIITKQVIIPNTSQPLNNYPASKLTDKQLFDELISRGFVGEMVKKLS